MRAESWSNSLFETLNEAIMILDANFCVVALNPVAEQLLGVSSQFDVGHADRFFTGLSVPEPQAQEARERLMRGGLVKERVWFQRSNGTQFRAEFLAKPFCVLQFSNIKKLHATSSRASLKGYLLISEMSPKTKLEIPGKLCWHEPYRL